MEPLLNVKIFEMWRDRKREKKESEEEKVFC
jgi:hypothetical protein